MFSYPHTSEWIYPVIPQNQQYLQGQVRHIRSTPSVKGTLVTALILLVISIGALVIGFWSWFDTLSLERNGVSTAATITDHRTYHYRNGTNYYLTYSFTAPSSDSSQDQTFSKEAEVTEQTYQRQNIHSSIQIIYQASDPTVSEIPNQFFPAGFTIGALFGLFGLLAAVTGLWNLRVNRLVVRKGVLLSGYVVYARVARGRRGSTSLKLTYSFADPYGQTVTRTKTLANNHYTQAINQSTRLGILYYNSRHFRLL